MAICPSTAFTTKGASFIAQHAEFSRETVPPKETLLYNQQSPSKLYYVEKKEVKLKTC